MIGSAVAAMAETRDAAGVVLVGGTLTLLAWVLAPLWLAGVLFVTPLFVAAAPVALAPALVARGYLVRVTGRAAETGGAGAPALVAWGSLFRDGVKSALLSVALLAPLAVGLGAIAAAAAGVAVGPLDPSPVGTAVEAVLGPDGPTAVAAVTGSLLAALVAAYLLAFAYVRPAALAAFAATGRLRDGLSPRSVAAVARSGSYATAWTVAVATLAVGYAVAAPTAPLLVGVALAFVVRVLAHGHYGRGAAEALGPDGTAGAGDRTTTTDAASAVPGATDPGTTGGFEFGVVERPGDSPTTAGDGGSTLVSAGDGERPRRAEPPSAVQVGRTVGSDRTAAVGRTVGGGRTAAVGRTVGGGRTAGVEPTACDESGGCGGSGDAGGFEWEPSLVEPEDEG